MGQCKAFVHETFQAGVGQLNRIGRAMASRHVPMQAPRPAAMLLAEYWADP